MERIKVSAPGKLMLMGEHSVIYGHPCIVTAVDQRMGVSIGESGDNIIRIHAPEVGLDNFSLAIQNLDTAEVPKGAKFITVGLRNFFRRFENPIGLTIDTSSEFSSQFGFGSSSAVTVGIIKGLSEFFGLSLSNRQIFDLSYQTVLDVQGVGSGFDLAAAIWGGTIYFITGGKEIKRLEVENLPMVIGYTGIKADTVSLVKKVSELRTEKPEFIEQIFSSISSLVQKGKVLLEKEDFVNFGKLMYANQELLDNLEVGGQKLSDLIYAARNAGALGAKLSGAGGGDCMIAFVDRKDKVEVENAIINAGGVIINARTGAQGVRIEK